MDIRCAEGRNVIVPIRWHVHYVNSLSQICEICLIRYLTFEGAMKVCSELGDLNSHLVPFNGFEEYEYFYRKSRYICRS